MSTISDLLGAHSAPITFEHGGKTYTVSAVTQERKSAVERYLKRVAYADLYAMREDLPADMYEDAITALQRDRSSYAYLGPVFWRTFGTEDGGVAMVSALLDIGETEARTLMTERGVEVQALVQEQIVGSMPRAQAEAVRAKLSKRAAKAPVATQTGADECPPPNAEAGGHPQPPA